MLEIRSAPVQVLASLALFFFQSADALEVFPLRLKRATEILMEFSGKRYKQYRGMGSPAAMVTISATWPMLLTTIVIFAEMPTRVRKSSMTTK